jgi:hypothetical protein
MVKFGEDIENGNKKKHKSRNKWKDFGEFLENYWWGLLIAGWILSWIIGDIGDAVRPNVPIVKEKAVVVQIVNERLDDYKVKYINDGAVQVVDLGDNAYVVGDTILIER